MQIICLGIMPKADKQSHKIKKEWFLINFFQSLDPIVPEAKTTSGLSGCTIKLFYFLKVGLFGFPFFSFNSDNLYSKNNFVFRSVLPEIYHKINRWVQSIHDDSVKDINVRSMTTEAIAFSSWNTEYARF